MTERIDQIELAVMYLAERVLGDSHGLRLVDLATMAQPQPAVSQDEAASLRADVEVLTMKLNQVIAVLHDVDVRLSGHSHETIRRVEAA